MRLLKLFIKVVVEHLFHGEQMPEDQMQDIFNLMDTNGDGQIDGNEAYNAATQFETTGK
jgi:Ca2+-binding EF-hand superfamily protein